jgi:hypothetical protein
VDYGNDLIEQKSTVGGKQWIIPHSNWQSYRDSMYIKPLTELASKSLERQTLTKINTVQERITDMKRAELKSEALHKPK